MTLKLTDDERLEMIAAQQLDAHLESEDEYLRYLSLERRMKEDRAAWCEHHQGQAERLRATLKALIARHEEQAERLSED